MSRVCSVCGKSKMSGNKVSHSNRRTPKTYSANVQKVKVMAENGAVSSEYVCAKCLKAGKVNRTY
ncbi:MAG: 50S ribosomal protein L28 [Clostridia bacterium]|nr:50S ribosomal protein L28 [Clostridia bacterium]